jgi:SagB-type dehydrogenase family enzyme
VRSKQSQWLRADDGFSSAAAICLSRVPFRVRRAPHLVSYWRNGALTLRNYATGEAVTVSPVLFLLLDFCTDWRTLDEVLDALPMARRPVVARTVKRLVAKTIFERSDRARDPRITRMQALDPWNPEAGFFHTATKDVQFWTTARAQRAALAKAKVTPMPRTFKRYPGVPAVSLPPPPTHADFPSVLLARRTWRRYSNATVSLDDLGTVLGLCAGVQKWAKGLGGDLPLKTSPSGGARHPIECYVVAQRVSGLRSGVYHYSSGRHELERLRGAVPPARVREYVPHGGYFATAPVMVFFTAMFERQLWRYSYSRAYRAALIEAGHVCQTLLLTATWLGLAPYSVMGLADSVIEHDLGIDGITESVLYAAGFGRPPRGTPWAPFARESLKVRANPRLG